MARRDMNPTREHKLPPLLGINKAICGFCVDWLWLLIMMKFCGVWVLYEPINYFFVICNNSVLRRLEYLSIPYIFIAKVREVFETTIGNFLLCRFLYYSIENFFKFLFGWQDLVS